MIRRELRLVEDDVFNTEALKFSIKRLNQLGYFKALEGGKDVNVEKTPGETNKVDVKLKLEEQNRNQLTFGAGVSEYEGIFGQLSFQTSNFLGRGESLTVSLQSGSRAQTYSIGFTEPFMFDRNMTLGAQVFRTNVRYVGQYTQKSTGTVLTLGYPLGRGFWRMFNNYSYQRVQVSEINELYTDPTVLQRNPFLARLAPARPGRRAHRLEGHAERRLQLGRPADFPDDRQALDRVDRSRRPRRQHELLQADARRRVVHPPDQPARVRHARPVRIHPPVHRTGVELPIFEKLFLGGEYSVRGFDIRTIGPSDPKTPYLIVGGDKSLLFNFEEQFTIAGPVRLIAFYDAGQVQPGADDHDVSVRVDWRVQHLSDAPRSRSRCSDFKTSTGLEVRFFMPVLNVPFRLIFAYNGHRAGVYDNSLQPQKAFQFRFAVGSTF